MPVGSIAKIGNARFMKSNDEGLMIAVDRFDPVITPANVCEGSSGIIIDALAGTAYNPSLVTCEWLPLIGISDPNSCTPTLDPFSDPEVTGSDFSYAVAIVPTDFSSGLIRNFNLTSVPAPTITITPSYTDVTTCGSNVTLTATGAPAGSTYKWNTTQTTSSINILALNTIDYAVTVTPPDGGCPTTANFTVEVLTPPKSLQDFTNDNCTALSVCSKDDDALCDTNGSTTCLVDDRDGKNYRIRKF